MKILIIILLTSLTFYTKCTKEKNNDVLDLTSDKWEVVKIKLKNSSNFINAQKQYILEFKNDNSFTLNLDVNNCSGNYEIENDNFSISEIICTEVCCDSEFAVLLTYLLYETSIYNYQNNNLVLEGAGEGTIVLKYN